MLLGYRLGAATPGPDAGAALRAALRRHPEAMPVSELEEQLVAVLLTQILGFPQDGFIFDGAATATGDLARVLSRAAALQQLANQSALPAARSACLSLMRADPLSAVRWLACAVASTNPTEPHAAVRASMDGMLQWVRTYELSGHSPILEWELRLLQHVVSQHDW